MKDLYLGSKKLTAGLVNSTPRYLEPVKWVWLSNNFGGVITFIAGADDTDYYNYTTGVITATANVQIPAPVVYDAYATAPTPNLPVPFGRAVDVPGGVQVGDRLYWGDEANWSTQGVFVVVDKGLTGVRPFILERALDLTTPSQRKAPWVVSLKEDTIFTAARFTASCRVYEDNDDYTYGEVSYSQRGGLSCGFGAYVKDASGVALCESAYSTHTNAVAIGRLSRSTGPGGMAIGHTSTNSGDQGVALGHVATNSGAQGTAVGYNCTNSAPQGVAIGAGITNSVAGVTLVGNQNGAVLLGGNVTYAAATVTAQLSDMGRLITFSNAVTFTIPPVATVAWPIGAQLRYQQGGTGAIAVSAPGVTITGAGANTSGQWQYRVLEHIATNQWRRII